MQPDLQETRLLFNRITREPSTSGEKIPSLLKVFQDLVFLLSDLSLIHFNTLFARTSFITSHYPVGKAWAHAFQWVRREMYRRELSDEKLMPVLLAVNTYLLEIYDYAASGQSMALFPPGQQAPAVPLRTRRGMKQKDFARVVVMSWLKEQHLLTIVDEEEPGEMFTLDYASAGINDLFAETLEEAFTTIGLPLVLGLKDISINDKGYYIPSYIVLLPDLLMDVTAIAKLSQNGGRLNAYHLLDLFLPSASNEALMTGNIANYILDELVRHPIKTFDALFSESFKLFPVEYVRMTDDQVRNLSNKLKDHYLHIRRAVLELFPAIGIDQAFCIIEPSYISSSFGIKGRLDLYYEDEVQRKASIIELKSSKPFMPNAYGLSSDHYHQTLLYDLLVGSTLASDFQRTNYILYSGQSDQPLRYAVSVDVVQKEAIHHRNQLVLLHYLLMQQGDSGRIDLFQQIKPDAFPEVKGYLKQNIYNWYELYQALSQDERSYFRAFAAYITREHTLARIGNDKGEGTGGLAGLWLDPVEIKEERYQILRGLVLVSINEEAQQTTLHFRRTALTNPLANFRAGDVIVLYPAPVPDEADPSRYQLYKASLLDIDPFMVTLRLYNRQVHTGRLSMYEYWNVEPDLLDSSFRPLYQSLYYFVKTEAPVRRILLGLVLPERNPEQREFPIYPGLTLTQQRIYLEALRAGSLYLLWGPPGTGKTSMMLKAWTWYYYRHSSSRMMLLAYTNRAVDEICEALESSEDDIAENYIRIGSRAGTGSPYRRRLLDQVISPCKTRAEIKTILDKTRIYVATVSSLNGKSELFRMLSFDVAIVDEASQLLEPAIIGVLPLFKKSILIGDHLQLPAVSTQPAEMSRVKELDSWAQKIGLTDLGMSYFERLFRLYQRKGWHTQIGMLDEQGRMHEDIMRYANQYMYNGLLKTVDQRIQQVPLHGITSPSTEKMFLHRLLYYPSSHTLEEGLLKTNRMEASLVIRLVRKWCLLIQEKELQWSIGVITPFRAQIAAILHEAHLTGTDMTGITVDTVERYQGGARDVIIMSCAVNSSSSLRRILSLSEEQIDRKLNVAITRARQQFILIGQQSTLLTNPSYAALIRMSEVLDPETDI